MNSKAVVQFKRPVMGLLGAVLFILFVFFFFVIFLYEKHANEDEVRKQLSSVDSLFSHYAEVEQELLGTFLKTIENDKVLQQAFLSGSREELLKAASPFFSRLLAEHDISHYYFVKPDLTCFLRVHNPGRYGDLIDRYTMQQAALSGKPSYGIELGKFGTFTLRVVYPWIVNKKLIGYVELGREIDYITPELKKILGVELFFLVKKEFLSREDWQEGLRMSGRSGSWDELADYVVIDRTLPGIPERFKNKGVGFAEHKSMLDVRLGEKEYQGGAVPLLDARGQHMGVIISLTDSTARQAEQKRIFLLLSVCVSLGGAGYFFFYISMGRLEAGLKKAYGGLEEEIELRKGIEGRLRDHEEQLEQQVAERTAELRASNESLLEEMKERQESEKKVQQARDELEKSFNAIGDLITIQDADMTVIRANRAAAEFFGQEMGHILGRKCYEIFQGGASPCPGCPVQESHLDRGNHTEIINHERLGRIFTVNSAPVFDADGKLQYLVHVAQDITQQKKLEEDLLQAQKMEAVGNLASGIAHDFNNILAAILGYSALAKRDLPPHAAAQEDIDQVIAAGQRATALVQQILDFSRKIEQTVQPLQPHLIVQDALRLLRSTLPSSVEIQEDIDPASGTILADSTRIHQIVMNLCTNGFHALKDEKGTLLVTLSRQEKAAKDLSAESTVSSGPFIVLSVSDTGQGMDPKTAAHIFEPYFTTKERGCGTGLGLAVVHGIVEGYKGLIEVESKPGQGCTFRVFIPALETELSVLGSAKEQGQDALSTGTERILIIDDEPLLVKINKRLLEDYGYTVTGSTDSREALEKVLADPQQFDLIVTDQTMPGLSGSELAKAVLEVAPHMPIIICTGHSAVTSKEEAMAMGIRKYLHKPVQKDELARTVRMVLDERKK
ncbi:MAG: response regulator [Desulfocapsaceae bacterium]|nr:response regulator [Desulfocapsaceae bacterium]